MCVLSSEHELDDERTETVKARSVRNGSDGSMRRYVQIATGSACEVESELLVARDLEYISATTADDLIGQVVELRRMLITLLKAMAPRHTTR